MLTTLPLASGILLPEAVLHSHLFAVLAAFVAINTVMYVALALEKLLPKVYAADWIQRRNQRAQSRSIYPDGLPLIPIAITEATLETLTATR